MKDFFKYTLASLLGNLLGLALIMTLGIGGLLYLVINLASQQPELQSVKNKSILVLDLSLTIRDSQPRESISMALDEALSEKEPEQITLRKVVEVLDKAKTDPKIVGLYLRGSSDHSRTGWGNLKEVRLALEKFKESQKPIIAYDTNWQEREYYLGSVAHQIFINPSGNLELNGFTSEVMFLSGALQKLGIGVQVTRVGKYKSAVEPFLLSKMSPENRQQIQSLLGDLWNDYLQSVGSSRQLIKTQLQTITNQNVMLTPQQAIQNKLVDKIAYDDQLMTELKKLTNQSETDSSLEEITIRAYAKLGESQREVPRNVSSKNKIALVYAEGEIVDGNGGEGQIGSQKLVKELTKIRLDNQVKAVVLRINSPGGSATASEIISREISLIRQKKPMIISMGNYAASGGYWLAMNGSRILAQPNTITGSIGVFGLLFNVQNLAQNNGITWEIVKTAPWADIGTVSRPKNPQELSQIQRLTDQIYNRFLYKVSQTRKIPIAQVREIAQGRVWSGSSAIKLGLVDELGGLNQAILVAAKAANLGDNWKIEEYPKVKSLEEKFLQKFSGSESLLFTHSSYPLASKLSQIYEELNILTGLNDPQGIYTRLPFTLTVD